MTIQVLQKKVIYEAKFMEKEWKRWMIVHSTRVWMGDKDVVDEIVRICFL